MRFIFKTSYAQDIQLAPADTSTDSILQVNTGTHAVPVWQDVAVLHDVGAGETINIIFDPNQEALAFSNPVA